MHVDATKIGKHHYHVVVDAANSVGNLSVPHLLRDLGCKVTTINGNIDGAFPGRLPEPRPENLKDLADQGIRTETLPTDQYIRKE